MKKKYLLSAGVLVLLILISSIALIMFSYEGTSVTIGQNQLTPTINNEGSILDPIFTGYVQSETVVYIYNSGWLDLENVVIHIEAYFTSNYFTYNRVKVGEDTNSLGTLNSGMNTSKIITVKLNLQITRLAIEDGVIELDFDISLSPQKIPYTLEFHKISLTDYDAPFSP